MNWNQNKIINGLTIYRIVAAPVLFILVFSHQLEIFKWLLALSFFTDAVDGFLARRYKIASILGARLDSIGDDLTVAAAMAGTIVLEPEFLRRELVLFLVLLAVFLVQNGISFIRFGKASSLHTYGAKIAAVMQGIFFLLLFFLANPVYFLFYIALAITALELIEEIIILLLMPKLESDVKGLYWVLKKLRMKNT